jgi:hypothetical protein
MLQVDKDRSEFSPQCDSLFDKDGVMTPEVDDFQWVSIPYGETLLHEAQSRILTSHIKAIIEK